MPAEDKQSGENVLLRQSLSLQLWDSFMPLLSVILQAQQ